MSLLVINSRVHGVTHARHRNLARGVSGLIQRARIAELPVAHLHQGALGQQLAMQIPIGRFDPVFTSPDLAGDFPPGLIEFLVRSSSKTINVAGLIRRDQLTHLTILLENTGYVARTHTSVLAIFDGEPVG